MKKDLALKATYDGPGSCGDLARAPSNPASRSSPAEEEGRDVQARFLFGVNRSTIVT